MKKFKSILSTLCLLFAACVCLLPATPAFADCAESVCECENVAPSVKAAAGCPGTSIPRLEDSIISVVNAVIFFLGIVAVIFIVYGGVSYMISLGDPSKVKRARDTILYAVIGLVICALAYVIVNFAIGILNNHAPNGSLPTTRTIASLFNIP